MGIKCKPLTDQAERIMADKAGAAKELKQGEELRLAKNAAAARKSIDKVWFGLNEAALLNDAEEC